MTIPGMLDEPVFLRNMYASFTEALQNKDHAFSIRDFIKTHMGIQASLGVNVNDVAKEIFEKMVEERPDYGSVIRSILHPRATLSETPKNLLMHAEMLQRSGEATEEDIVFFQKYAFKFAFLSEWKHFDSVSGADSLQRSFEKFESLRVYRKELSQILRIEASHIMQLMKKVLPKHVPSSEIRSQAEEVCTRIQNFFNKNLSSPEKTQGFPIEGTHLTIEACVKNKQGELICYNDTDVQGLASHLIVPFGEKASTINACRIRALEPVLCKEVDLRKKLCKIPHMDDRIDTVTLFQDGHSFVQTSLPSDKLDYQLCVDPLSFSGIELIEVCKQVIQTMQKLADRRYCYEFLDPRNIFVRKTERGVEAKVGDLLNIVSLLQVGDLRSDSQNDLCRCYLPFLRKVLFGVDASIDAMEEMIFYQAKKILPESQYLELLSVKEYCLKYGKSCIEGLQDFLASLKKKDIDAFSASALKQFTDRVITFFCLHESLFSYREISFKSILEALDQAEETLKGFYGNPPQLQVPLPSKSHFYQYLPRFATQQETDLFYEIFSSSLQKHTEIGSDVRFHKGDFWQGHEVPFSFRIQVEKSKVVLTFFFPQIQERSYANAKLAWQMQILPYGATALIPIEVIRDNQFDRANSRREIVDRARTILKLPGACKYFSYPPEQSLSYQGSVNKKWEMFSERYKENLSEFDVEDQIHVLFHILQGLKLLAKNGLVYGELHQGNIGVYRRDDGQARARLLWKTDPKIIFPPHYNSYRKEQGKLTLQSDTYAFIRLLAETLLPDLQKIDWENLDLYEIKAQLQEKRESKELDLRTALEVHMEDIILPFLIDAYREDVFGESIPNLQEIEDVLVECFEVLDEPFLYLHPVFAVKPVPTEA